MRSVMMNRIAGEWGVLRWLCDMTSVCVAAGAFWGAIPSLAALASLIYSVVMIWKTLRPKETRRD